MASSSESPHDFVEIGFSDVVEHEHVEGNSEDHPKSSDEMLDPQDEKAFQDAHLSIPLEEAKAANDNREQGVEQQSTSTQATESLPPQSTGNNLSESAAEFGRRMLNNMTPASGNESERLSAFHQQGSRSFFSNREGVFENAVEEFKRVHMTGGEDGEMRGAWLLTQIDHWDLELERLVVVSDVWLLVVKYDFIGLHVPEIMRIPLHGLGEILIGDFKYPLKSLMPKRSSSGVRALWNCNRPATFASNWNPWSKQIPWVTFTSHPMYLQRDRDQNTYNVDTFVEALCEAVKQSKEKYNMPACKVNREPIMIESYAGVASAIHNLTALGFYKVRGKISF